jgi:hypothetical protein
MAKKTRNVIGSVLKSKEAGQPDYVKINKDVTLKQGQTLRLESKKQQIDSAKAAIAAGKLTGDLGATILERLEKIPDFVRFEIVSLEDK